METTSVLKVGTFDYSVGVLGSIIASRLRVADPIDHAGAAGGDHVFGG